MDEKYTNIKERLLYFAKNQSIGIENLLKEIGMTYGSFKGRAKEGSLNSNAIVEIYTKYPQINIEWLLTGYGDMIKIKNEVDFKEKKYKEKYKVSDPKPNIHETEGMISGESHGMTGLEGKKKGNKTTTSYRRIPLIPIGAMAGYGGGEIVVNKNDLMESYVVPEFEEKGVKYMIRVSGSSMYPKYGNGDLLGCKPIKDLSFFQWGKPYVLDTDQGAMVKRLFPIPDNEELLECRSDNDKYPPFPIRKESIYRIAIVLGVIRLE